MSAKGQLSEQSVISRSVRPVTISLVLGMLVCGVLLLAMSGVIASRGVPHSMIDPMAIAAISAGAFISGFCCARFLRSQGLVYGAVCGAVLSLVVLMVGLGVSEAPGLGAPGFFRFVFIMLSAMLGGVLGVGGKKGKK